MLFPLGEIVWWYSRVDQLPVFMASVGFGADGGDLRLSRWKNILSLALLVLRGKFGEEITEVTFWG